MDSNFLSMFLMLVVTKIGNSCNFPFDRLGFSYVPPEDFTPITKLNDFITEIKYVPPEWATRNTRKYSCISCESGRLQG